MIPFLFLFSGGFIFWIAVSIVAVGETAIASILVHPLGIVGALLCLILSSYKLVWYQRERKRQRDEEESLIPRPAPESLNADSQAQGVCARQWVWGSRFVSGLLVLYVVALLIVAGLTWDGELSEFPTSCPDNTDNCSRLAGFDSEDRMRAEDVMVPILPASRETLRPLVKSWIADVSNELSTIVVDKPEDGFVQGRILSALFAFPDDFFVSIRCTDDGQAALFLQAQARLGYSDLEVNDKRLKDFVKHFERIEVEAGECVEG